ncbi:TrkH family potassium uptake protein [Streptococcus sp. zg-86]|uniref:TrkH family potassium uptake protein n=1 Tax=Streptococcus zhangguiae TaxID=2664091 RepID=A0A6I4RTQ3_9STRE|nr:MULTISPECIES: potassium transporter TrkG [unclassified Streptococcus]MTB64353.1 TrkH family potassium uptake protein [Streptococcus sp. zg-86]MTB90663.1 TrkH family potassium uptake protein [Streptococcus sp. zg-36]MWV56342.1 TrkH family potassium uptake protein [Streptococcus sp. zg-70]QTH47446.1 TrkH family potassium uptake protein [Streptococcus sp. zg-86]
MSSFSLKFTPSQRIVLSFAGVILIGSLLLSLPISQLVSSEARYWDHLFTTISMVCVTGLFTVPVAETYNTFGQLICMLLIQIGGLSLISFIGLFALRGGRKLSFINMATLQESFNVTETKHFRSFIKSVFGFTFAIETIGALILSFQFVPEFGWQRGLFSAFFVAISAFCNAGFDNFGATSLVNYATSPLINLTIASLIIMGGLGFSVWFDMQTKIQKRLSFRKFSFHTKVVLTMTTAILLLGTLLTLLTEYRNPDTIGSLSLPQKILVSFFQTVTMRTAGFASIDYTKANPVTLLLYTFQMMLGGAPGGTAGGIKITAFLTLILYARSEIIGLPHTNFKARTIDNETIRKAFATFIVFIMVFLVGLFAISMTDPHKPMLLLIFEVMSALATVGVTANLTPQLSQLGQLVIMALMFFGRIGPMSILISLSSRKLSKEETIQYAKSSMIV